MFARCLMDILEEPTAVALAARLSRTHRYDNERAYLPFPGAAKSTRTAYCWEIVLSKLLEVLWSGVLSPEGLERV